MSEYDISQAEVEVLTGLKAIELLKLFLCFTLDGKLHTIVTLDDGRFLEIKRPSFDDPEMRGRFV